MKFKIAIINVGSVEKWVLRSIKRGLSKAYSEAEVEIPDMQMDVPEEAYDFRRNQYYSSPILFQIRRRFSWISDKILGVTEADLYVPHLNFVFGEAECPGKAAIISLYRLRPEFYGYPPDKKLFIKRCIKEAVHEIGHTLGLGHCDNPKCVMHFSNSIWDTCLLYTSPSPRDRG